MNQSGVIGPWMDRPEGLHERVAWVILSVIPVLWMMVVGYLSYSGPLPQGWRRKPALDIEQANKHSIIPSIWAALLSLLVGYRSFGANSDPTTFSTILKATLLLGWVLLPPVALWFEYSYIYKYDEKTFDILKYRQDMKSKIWLALVTGLTGLYFGKDLWRKS
jgi:hypothetical protein